MAPNSTSSTVSPYRLALLLLFAGSGFSALIYETVWYQSLELAIGMTSVSIAFLLATFMGGLCIGSLALPRSRLVAMHPLRLYALIEFGIAICAILAHLYLPLVSRIYVFGAHHGMPGSILRAFIASAALLPATILMGASLPAFARWLKSSENSVSWWGLLYGANTFGAVFGCLCAGFFLLRLYSMGTAVYIAASINVVVGVISLSLASKLPAIESDESTVPNVAIPISNSTGSAKPILFAIAISGATALGAEIIWTRLLGYLFGLTVYAFSMILAVFLVGISIGSALGSFASRVVRPRVALAWAQLLLTAGIAWTAWIVTASLPFWPINSLLQISPWHIFQLDLVRSIWAMLPPTILWGASFPLAVAAVAEKDSNGSRVIGNVYAANTAGAIVGALVTSLALIPWIGTQQSQRVLLCAAAVSGLTLLAFDAFRSKTKDFAPVAVAAVLIISFLCWSVSPIPGELIAYGRRLPLNYGKSQVIYTSEGRNSSLAITQWNDGAIELDVNGHVEATTEVFDMKLQRMVGHLPALLNLKAKSVLGIGFGAGVSAGTFTLYPNIEHITICEIEPNIPPTSNHFFGPQNYNVLVNPKTHVVYDDARHFLITTNEKFDIIASDPLDVFVKGTAAIYSKEYFENVKRHLNPDGLFTLYVPLYESDVRTVKSELATFIAAFPNTTVWANTINGNGYDMVFMGHLTPPKIDLDGLSLSMDQPEYGPVRDSLSEIGFAAVGDLLATYAGRDVDYKSWTAGAQLNTDADLRLQYLAGWGINSSLEDVIYREMIAFRKTPSDLFMGSSDRVSAMLAHIEGVR